MSVNKECMALMLKDIPLIHLIPNDVSGVTELILTKPPQCYSFALALWSFPPYTYRETYQKKSVN